jgi:hypothetical protein
MKAGTVWPTTAAACGGTVVVQGSVKYIRLPMYTDCQDFVLMTRAALAAGTVQTGAYRVDCSDQADFVFDNAV